MAHSRPRPRPRPRRAEILRRIGLWGLLPIAAAGCVTTAGRTKLDPKALGPSQAQARTDPSSKAPDHANSSLRSGATSPKATPGRQFDVHLDLARVYETQGDAESAIAEYQKAIEAASTGRLLDGSRVPSARKALAHRRMGGTLDRLGRFAQAETHYREALQLSPDDPLVWNDAGYSYHLQGRFDDAERSLRTAAKLSPTDSRIQTNLGLTLAAAGKTDAALAALTRAGGPAVAHANLGYILAATGKTDAAREQYQAALAIRPDLGAAKLALSSLDSRKLKDAAALAAAPPAVDRGVARANVAAKPPAR